MDQALIGNGFTGVCLLVMVVYYSKYHNKDKNILIEEDMRIATAKQKVMNYVPDASDKRGFLESEFNKLDTIMCDSGLKQQWKQFVHSNACMTKVDNHGIKRVYFTHDIYEVLDPHTCVMDIEGYKRRALVPSFMTGLGILGTFIGLTWGLLNLDINASGSGLLSSINTLISSSGTAFVTSLAGVSLSLFHIYSFHSLERNIKKSIDELILTVHRRIGYWSIFDELGEIKKTLEESNENIEDMAVSLDEIYNYTTNVANDIVQKTGQSIKDKVTHQFTDEFNQLVGTIGELKEYLEDEQQNNKDINSKVVSTMEDALTRLKDTIEDLDNKWQEKNNDIIAFKQDVADSIASASSTVKDATDRLEVSLSGMSNGLESLKNDTVDSLTTSMDTFGDKINTFNQLVDDQRDLLDKTVSEYIQRIEGERTSFVETLDENKQLVENMIAQAEQSSSDRDDSLAKMLNVLIVMEDKVKDSLNTVCNEAIAKIQQAAASSNQDIVDKTQALQEKSLGEFNDNLKDMLAKVSGAIQDQTDIITGEQFINSIKQALNDNSVGSNTKGTGDIHAK